MLSDVLPLTTCDLPAPDWGRLGEQLPVEWIMGALSYTGKASIRQRRLPAEQVVWLVIALAIYRHHSVRQVLGELELALPDLKDTCVTDSAVTQARQRLGEEPLAWLFSTSARHWQMQDAHRSDFHGLQLLAMDGTTLKLADSAENRAHFDSPHFAKGALASYPHARMVTLAALRTQLVLAADFGPYSKGEMSFALPLLDDIPDHSLTVFDKGFLAAELLHKLRTQGQERHFLVPAKANTQWRLVSGDSEDGIVEMRVSPQVRKRDPSMPEQWQARAIATKDPTGKLCYLLTSLTDRRRFSAKTVRDCYSERWQIETSYREIKQTMMGMALCLRSQSVAATRQEIWGILIAYNLVRLEMARTADQAKCAPNDVSFVFALGIFQLEMLHAASERALGNLPGTIKRMRERMILELNVYRPDRKFDRVTKAKPQRYPERRLRKSLT
ncbi:IS4 family transposase [Duganella hordei]|uniref:IS4 family transposase n=1 Tax=Duganella hordei TaxID=2865934 RepID=UPI0030E920B1